MRRVIRDEAGTAIVTAIALMSVMIGFGLATYSFVDGQQGQAMRERQRESSFNLAEATLNNQAFILSRRWASSAVSYPTSDPSPTCSQASAPAAYCPQPAQLAAAFTSKDYATGKKWQTTVWDDVAGDFYDRSAVEKTGIGGNKHYDANGNNRIWIKASAVVRGRERALVALVEIQQQIEDIPKKTIIAGEFKLTPNGNHAYVLTVPDQFSKHPVTVRCDPATPGCLEYTPDKKNPQIDPPDAVEQGFAGEDALDDETKARLKERAIADGTYYTSCPTDDQLTGKVVWVEGCADGNYTKSSVWNSAAKPGMLIWKSGTLELGGQSTFYGIVYHLNDPPALPGANVLRLRGGLTINGGVFIDGTAGIDVGSNTVNIVFDPSAFVSVSSYGTAGIVQNSWRELTGNSQ